MRGFREVGWVAAVAGTALGCYMVSLKVASERAAAFWEAVRPNLAKVSEAGDWWRVVTGPVAPVIADPAFIGAAAALLPAEPWDAETWKAWTGAVEAATGAKGKALFMPLRLALTGLDHGPELADLLALIGRDRALARRP